MPDDPGIDRVAGCRGAPDVGAARTQCPRKRAHPAAAVAVDQRNAASDIVATVEDGLKHLHYCRLLLHLQFVEHTS